MHNASLAAGCTVAMVDSVGNVNENENENEIELEFVYP